MIDPLDQPTELCPSCRGPLTRVRAYFMCLSFEHDCDYRSERHTPMRITEPGIIEARARHHAIRSDIVLAVVDYVLANPWSTIREIAGSIGSDDAVVREAMRYRENFGIVRVRSTIARCPYRYAHGSVTTKPDTKMDLDMTVIPWSSGFKPSRDSDEDTVSP